MTLNSPATCSNSSTEKGPRIPIIVQISVDSMSSSADCVDRRRFGACNLMNTGLMRSVNALIPAITIHHQLGGAEFTGFSVALMYSNKTMRLAKSHLHTFPIASQRVVS